MTADPRPPSTIRRYAIIVVKVFFVLMLFWVQIVIHDVYTFPNLVGPGFAVLMIAIAVFIRWCRNCWSIGRNA
jgi:hypothetical protein